MLARRRAACALSAGSAILLLQGCRVALVDIPPQTMTVSSYELALPESPTDNLPTWCRDHILTIEPFLTADAYDTRFYTSLPTGEVRLDEENRWILEPGRLLSHAFQRGLAGTDVFKHVADGRSRVSGTLRLEGKVMQFSKTDSETSPHGQAVLSVTLSLHAIGAGSHSKNDILWKAVLTECREMQNTAPDAFVAAMSDNVEAALAAFLEGLARTPSPNH